MTRPEQPLWEVYRERLEQIGALSYNFDPEKSAEYTRKTGWRVDAYEAELPFEQPGQPEEWGPFQVAKGIVQDYRFPPPGLIQGIYYPDRPLAERYMLLKAHFLWMTFFFGVKIGGVIDTLKETEAGQEQIWGYNYRTLQGHFEKGQIEFLVVKNLQTGKVFFRIQAYSRPDRIKNLIYQIGFWIFGRPLQLYFARESMKRMVQLVQAELQGKTAPEGPKVRPVSQSAEATEALKDVKDQQKEQQKEQQKMKEQGS
ncbi:DUF1990 family protein [Deinococcus roseus]|uniref:DUF1990 domain-containing protein n=1 Tax=Deinococcus roseus TaxID=392414 RepID=A0ABQ2CU58_9DEIO|nr:DUF1990 family protein [Deinococcus roseus]GGJ20896.1 DUF1990 domain-containing protein [Deinococcus roseus]